MTNRQTAIKIIKRLRGSGFEALLAGGCVRDMLLKKPAKDYDVATNATPGDVIRLFKRTLKVGAKFGVVIVLVEDRQVEVATFRTETGYADGRRPDRVEFSSASEDAVRRDFTINGMFYDPLKKEVIDYVEGQRDLKKRLIRTIGEPQERFGEDYLRMLRAVRFSTQLGFVIEPKTWSAVCSNAKNISKISGERIAMELEAVLANPERGRGVKMLLESGLAEVIFPGLAGKKIKLAVKVLGWMRRQVDFALALAGLFADCESAYAIKKCSVLKLSRDTTRHVKFLLVNKGKLLDEKMSLAELKLTASEPYFGDLYELQRAIEKASGRSTASLAKLRKRIKALRGVELRPKPLLNGHELIGLGAVAGPGLGQLSEEMYIAQLEGKLKQKEQAERWAEKWLQKHSEINK